MRIEINDYSERTIEYYQGIVFFNNKEYLFEVKVDDLDLSVYWYDSNEDLSLEEREDMEEKIIEKTEKQLELR